MARANRRAKGRARWARYEFPARSLPSIGRLRQAARFESRPRWIPEPRAALLAKVEGRDDPAVPLEARSLEIVEQAAPLRDEGQETAPRMVVFDVRLEVLGQVRDALRQERDLHLGRSGVVIVRAELGDDFELLVGVQGHGSLSSARPPERGWVGWG